MKSSVKSGESFSDNFLPCNSCDFKTKIIDELRTHKDEHKQSKQKSNEESHGNPFARASKAPCASRFTGEDANRHRDSNLKCDECKQNFYHKDEFNLHMEFFHAGSDVVNPQ